jgi:DNA-binding phage protein
MERQRLQRAQAHVERIEREAQERVRAARAKRDAEILQAVENGGAITDIARALSMTREGIYSALRRARGQ